MHVIKAFPLLGDALRQQLWWILAISIHHQGGAALDVVQSRLQRALVAEVAREPQQCNTRTLDAQPFISCHVASWVPSST